MLALNLHLPSLPLPHSFLFTNKPPLAYPCIPPLPHTDTLASAHTFQGLNMLAFQCRHTRSHTGMCFPHSAPTWITKLVHTHPNNPSACLNTSTGPSPASKEHTPHSSPTVLLLANTPSLGYSDTPLTLAGPSPPWLLPSSSLSFPAPPSSQNSPCHCGHCHLRCCHG